jgi:hypothetical protein
MDRFQDGSFRVKEGILTIFCNFVMNHTHEMAELGRCDEFPAAGQETAAAVGSQKYDQLSFPVMVVEK